MRKNNADRRVDVQAVCSEATFYKLVGLSRRDGVTIEAVAGAILEEWATGDTDKGDAAGVVRRLAR